MKLKSGIAFIGAIVALAAVTGLYIGLGLIGIGISLGVIILAYLLAAIGAASLSSVSGFGEFMRGWLVGMNAGLNVYLMAFILGAAAGTAAGYAVGAALGLINLLAVFSPISRNGVYQGLLGWLNWLMPMSWLIVALGALFYLISFLLHGVTGGKVSYLRILDAAADLKTGTFFIKGGLIANLNPLDTAFNMGNFSFVDRASSAWHKEHEAGHTLNLAAFGSVFHLIGALDENATPRGERAFSERLAESNATGDQGHNLPMWS